MQATLTAWVSPKKASKKAHRCLEKLAFRFLMDFPEGIMAPDGPRGPFRRGDLATKDVLPENFWKLLLRKGAVEPVRLRPEWPGGD